jgi:hypothetical protein
MRYKQGHRIQASPIITVAGSIRDGQVPHGKQSALQHMYTTPRRAAAHCGTRTCSSHHELLPPWERVAQARYCLCLPSITKPSHIVKVSRRTLLVTINFHYFRAHHASCQHSSAALSSNQGESGTFCCHDMTGIAQICGTRVHTAGRPNAARSCVRQIQHSSALLAASTCNSIVDRPLPAYRLPASTLSHKQGL